MRRRRQRAFACLPLFASADAPGVAPIAGRRSAMALAVTKGAVANKTDKE